MINYAIFAFKLFNVLGLISFLRNAWHIFKSFVLWMKSFVLYLSNWYFIGGYHCKDGYTIAIDISETLKNFYTIDGSNIKQHLKEDQFQYQVENGPLINTSFIMALPSPSQDQIKCMNGTWTYGSDTHIPECVSKPSIGTDSTVCMKP